jgi:hypothetical protein
MALLAHPKSGYTVNLQFDGALDPDAPVVVEVDDPTICTGVLTSYDSATFVAVADFDHAGVAGTTAIRVRGDGDLGPGVTGVVWEETFEALPVGASAVTATVSGERPTATAPMPSASRR